MLHWALNKKKQVDIFYILNYSINVPSLQSKNRQKFKKVLKKYQTTMDIKGIKYIKN